MHPTNLDWTCTTVALNETTIMLFSDNCFVYNSRLSYQILVFLEYSCILLHSTSIYAKNQKVKKWFMYHCCSQRLKWRQITIYGAKPINVCLRCQKPSTVKI